MEDKYDVDGNLMKEGDRVEYLDSQWGRKKGELGIVCHLTHVGVGNSVGVNFDEPSMEGHTCAGTCPDGRGLWIKSSDLRIVSNPLETDEETIVTTLRELIAGQKSVALIGGKIFTVSTEKNEDAGVLIDSLVEAVSGRVREIQRQAEHIIMAERKKAQQAVPMPEITFEQVVAGLRIYKRDNWYCYLAPFLYAPKYLGADFVTPSKEISDEHKEALKREVFFECQVDTEGNLYMGSLYKPDFSSYFSHYHGAGDDCLGLALDSKRIKMETKIESPSDFLAFRDKYQKMLEVINGGHMRNPSPYGFPEFYQLERNSKKLDTKKVWTTKNIKKEEAPVGLSLEVNTPVRILQEKDGLDRIGAVARVKMIREDVGAEVEFLDCKTWWYPLNGLEIMPKGTRRTGIKEENVDTPTLTPARKPWEVPPIEHTLI